MSEDTNPIRVAIDRALDAAEALNEFERKHAGFLLRTPPDLAWSSFNPPSISFAKASAQAVAKHFGNDGWTFTAADEFEKIVDGVAVRVYGLEKRTLAIPLVPHLGISAETADPTAEKIGIQTFGHSLN